MTQENTALLEALDTRLWCLHHIGPDEVHPAPDFDTAWKWAEWGNKTFAQHADISRFVVAVWPHAPEAHAADLPKSVAEWTLPATSPTDSLTADAAAVREAEQWLRACSDWLLTNDLDMQMPGGILDTDPLDIADSLAALPLPAQTVPADVAALVVAAREAWEFLEALHPGEDAADALEKALEPFASRVCWDDEGGSLPDAHAVPCSCGKGDHEQQPLRDALIQDAIDNGNPGKAARMAALAQPKGGDQE